MADQFLAEIRIFAFNFPPRGWAVCHGQILLIRQNTALFSLLGTAYGGNGRDNFALPNLQNSSALHPGQGPGLSQRSLGEIGGTETVQLSIPSMPAHNHPVKASGVNGSRSTPASNVWAAPAADRDQFWYASGNPTVNLDESALAISGGSQPHNNLMPYLVVNFCIALEGEFPSRP